MCTFIACREGEPGYEAISYVYVPHIILCILVFQEAQGWCTLTVEEVTEK